MLRLFFLFILGITIEVDYFDHIIGFKDDSPN